jgi:nitrite reductase/ring-hydroxylating ferredoxin subunit/uncharacterized membrane protein
VITDLPIGLWSIGVVFDLVYLFSGQVFARTAADVTIGMGVFFALIAAITGYTDWSDTVDRERRTGLVHGLLNLVATVLYLVSIILRLTHSARGLAIALALIGYVLALTAAYLGGELVFNIGTGVNHHGFEPPVTEWTAAGPLSGIPEGKPRRVVAGSTPVMVLRRGQTVDAIGATCAHAGGPLDEGTLEGNTVICPWHASRFDVRTGAVKGGPATISQVRYETRVVQGKLEIRRSPESPQPN